MRRLPAIRRLIHTLPKNEVILYVDEVDIHLNPKIGPDEKRDRTFQRQYSPKQAA